MMILDNYRTILNNGQNFWPSACHTRSKADIPKAKKYYVENDQKEDRGKVYSKKQR